MSPPGKPIQVPMNKSEARKFQLADAMILVAAAALAFADLRSRWPFGIPSLLADSGPKNPINNFLCGFNRTIFELSKFVACMTIACFILGLRPPRPGLRRLMRRPGMVACTVATAVLAIRLVNFAAVTGVFALDGFYPAAGLSAMDIHDDELRRIPSEIGCAVAAAWAVQRIGGGWRCEPTWLDRAGRALGAFWVATIPFAWFMTGHS